MERFIVFNIFDYSEHVITPRLLHIATKTIGAECNTKRRTIAFELLLFPGFCNVYRRFVPKIFTNDPPPSLPQQATKERQAGHVYVK